MPAWMDRRFGFAIGANNLFDVDPPGCFTCGLNNLDPTTYDVPGTLLLRPGEGLDVARAPDLLPPPP